MARAGDRVVSLCRGHQRHDRALRFHRQGEQFDTFYDEFNRIQLAFYEKLRAFRDETSLEIVQYYPNRVTINCAAVNNHAMMFGPNGRMYKCGLDVGDHHRAHATLGLDGAVTSSAAETGPVCWLPIAGTATTRLRIQRAASANIFPSAWAAAPRRTSSETPRDQGAIRILGSQFRPYCARIPRGRRRPLALPERTRAICMRRLFSRRRLV